MNTALPSARLVRYWVKSLRKHCSFYLANQRWHTGYLRVSAGRVFTRAVGSQVAEDITDRLLTGRPSSEQGREIFPDIPYRVASQIRRAMHEDRFNPAN